MSRKIEKNNDYLIFAEQINKKIEAARLRAGIKVNEEMLQLYWEISNDILTNQLEKGWGSKVIDILSQEIQKNFPDSSGFSVRNLKYMRSFAEIYPDFPIVQVPLAQNKDEKVQVPLAQITWYHHITLITKVKDPVERAFYIIETAQNDWSRNVMLHQIKSGLYERNGKSVNNFELTLPSYQSDLANNILKDPYDFDFLGIDKKIKELELAKKLTERISEFLIELGRGFAFVGRQYPMEIDGKDYKIDLLFYHTILHCYIVIELKSGEFIPEYISKLNFYINAVDDQLKTDRDEKTIGLLLCAEKSNVTVEYSMRGLDKPLGVAEYELENILRERIKKIK